MAHRRLTALVLAATVALAGAPSIATTVSTTGASATRTGNTVSVKDTSADAHSVFANINNTSNRLNNSSGYGTTASKTYTFKVTSVRACVNIQRAFDRCSDWG